MCVYMCVGVRVSEGEIVYVCVCARACYFASKMNGHVLMCSVKKKLKKKTT